MSTFIGKQHTNQPPEQLLTEAGTIFARFDAATQDSGNVSYGVRVGEARFFVKTAGVPTDSKPILTHGERVGLLRTAVALAKSCTHPVLVPLRGVIESPHGPMLVYDWLDGELVRNVLPRFRQLPAAEIFAALDTIYDLHDALARAGWVALDFYDGCLLYNFEMKMLSVMDLDMYRRGAFVNERGRLFGSSRYMAPEEFKKGAQIDQRSNVFTMGRTALNLLGDGTLARRPFRGSDAQFAVVQRACQPDPTNRYATMAAFADAWCSAYEG